MLGMSNLEHLQTFYYYFFFFFLKCFPFPCFVVVPFLKDLEAMLCPAIGEFKGLGAFHLG